MKGKDLLSISDLTGEKLKALIRSAVDMKEGCWRTTLSGKSLALVFEKPSLRTRVSFELAMRQLGGESLYLSPEEVGLGRRESIPDVARVLCRYVDVIAARTFAHSTVESLAAFASVPVINALSDFEHPCQALADLMTIFEKKGDLEGLTVAYTGDGNNVANSLMLASALAGVNFRIAAPKGYEVQEKVLSLAQEYADNSGSRILLTEDPKVAVRGADVVYTDVWTSMGQEAEAPKRREVFANYQVNSDLLALAREDAIIMHPLPAHRGEEVSADILDTEQSVVFDQAENRLHAQKALLAEMLGGLEILG
jgi:ornithine carbamoyltransferase